MKFVLLDTPELQIYLLSSDKEDMDTNVSVISVTDAAVETSE
jgi:hypothetical protein